MKLAGAAFLLLGAIAISGCGGRGLAPGAIKQPAQSGYAPVNGLQIYFEVHGTANPERPPLVLLHGGGDTINASFGHILPELARDRQIIAFEQQGYGHTADIADRPFSFEQSADDTAALLDYLHIEKADLFGFSNGAPRHPSHEGDGAHGVAGADDQRVSRRTGGEVAVAAAVPEALPPGRTPTPPTPTPAPSPPAAAGTRHRLA